MQNYSTVLDQNTWGIHLNFEGYFAFPPSCPIWLTQLQQQDWQRRGIVLWDSGLHVVAHLYASYALELLEHLHSDTAWKIKGLVIGSPAFQLSTSSANTPSTTLAGDWVLKNQIELNTDQAQAIIEFLTTQEDLLKPIALYDKEDAEESLRQVYRLIAAYGRKVREGKKSNNLIETTKANILPIFIPHGNYFTVYQAAQICHATSKQIRAWIRKGKLEAFDLPGLGIIIEAEELNEFRSQRNS
jgi:hypothetical protein